MMKIKINKTDKKWSQEVIKRDGKCLYCGCTEYLSAHHLFGRSKSATRFVLDNGFTLCPNCHVFSPIFSAHRTEQTFKLWAKKRLGLKRYRELEKLSNTYKSRKQAEKEFLDNLCL